jgi:hypothetical protein
METVKIWHIINLILGVIILIYGFKVSFSKREKNEHLQLGSRIGCLFSAIILATLLFFSMPLLFGLK